MLSGADRLVKGQQRGLVRSAGREDAVEAGGFLQSRGQGGSGRLSGRIAGDQEAGRGGRSPEILQRGLVCLVRGGKAGGYQTCGRLCCGGEGQQALLLREGGAGSQDQTVIEGRSGGRGADRVDHNPGDGIGTERNNHLTDIRISGAVFTAGRETAISSLTRRETERSARRRQREPAGSRRISAWGGSGIG